MIFWPGLALVAGSVAQGAPAWELPVEMGCHCANAVLR